jgi:CheY-like chemotaxis protein
VRTPELQEEKLIAVTGYGQDADRLQSQEAGFDYHLVKPVDSQKLEEVLAKLMKSSQFS